MEASTVFGIAIAAVISGGLLLALASLSARLFSRAPAPPLDELPGFASSLGSATEAVVVARRGGQVVYANDRARQLFGLNGGAANLNSMARLAQPQDTFFDLFAAEGHTSLTIANRPLDAVSVRIPGEAAQFVVLLRERAGIAGLRSADRPAQAAAALGEIGQIIASSLDLELTVNNILVAVGRITRYDLAEINLWDAEAQGLRPHTRVGDRTFTLALNRQIELYKLDEGYSGWIARNKRSLLIADAAQYTEVRPKVDRAEFPFHSMVGVPLLAQRGAEQELVGTIEIAALDVEVYADEELTLLEAVAGQAAVAIRNAQLYAAQAARIAELSGLAQVAQTASAIADPRELYGSLVDRLAKLMSVHLCGILIYDDSERALLSQPPFRGVPDAFIEHYRVPVPPGSAAARIWRESDSWYSNNLAEDPLVAELGLKDLANAIGVRSTLLVPLIVGGNRLGIVQVSNKINNTVFDDDDARLLRLFAGQAAALIDNARLVREAEQRAERAETLRQVSEITGSARALAEIYREVITSTVQMVKADFAAVLLLDETKGELTPQAGSLFGGTPTDAEAAQIDTDDPAFKHTVTVTRKPFFAWRATRDRRVAPLYQPALARFRSESVIIVPLVVQDRSIGELWLGARRERAFQRADVQLAATVAAQLASAIERTRLASVTDETLRYRVEQLTALTRVGRELNQTIELDHILQTVYDEAVRAARADCGSILLIDPGAIPQAARVRLGTDGEALTLDALEANVALSGASYTLGDIDAPGALAMLTPNATVAHSGIRSLLITPIIYQGGAVGIIELHSQKVNAFDPGILDFSQALAAQAAIAVGNAQRYEEQLQRGELLRHRADQLAQLLQISRAVRSDRPLTTNLEAIAFGVQEAVGFNVVVISVMEPGTDTLHRTVAAGVPLADFEELKLQPQSWSLFAPALMPEFSISQSYYIPHDRTPNELARADADTAARGAAGVEPGEWHPDDLLFVPLTGSGGQAVGMMSLDNPRDGRAPGRLVMETVEIFANQAALAIENARLYQSAQSRAAELSRSLAELQKSYQDLDAVSRALTRKELELSRLIEHTESRAKRLLALHRIASATADTRDEATFLELTARSTTAEMNLDVCVIALLAEGTLRVAAQAGATETAALSAQLASHNPLSQIIELRTPLLATDLGPLGWGESKMVRSLELRSFVGVPIMMAGMLEGVALVGSRLEQAPFTNEDIDVFRILAGQIGVGIENIRLYADVRERATQLEALTEVSRVISSALQQEDVVTLVLEQLGRVIAYDSATLWLREEENLKVAGARGFENDEAQLGLLVQVEDSRLFAEISESHQAIVVADTRQDARFPTGELSRTRSWLGVPLISKGQTLGLLALDKVEANFYSGNQAALALAFANQAAVALDNAQLFEESVRRAIQLNERSQRLALLNRVSSELNQTLDTDRILEIAAREMSNAMSQARVAAVMYDEA
ncbi:MAG: GAF domain-containing protein, partial [Chloroflexota bacterium]